MSAKRTAFVWIALYMAAFLSSCGEVKSSGGPAVDGIESEAVVSNGWSENTYIYGDSTDYGYTFAAEGTTEKGKDYMLSYYEDVQNLAVSSGGYVESVDNTFTGLNIAPDDYYVSDTERLYKSVGHLRFVLQVPNDAVPQITKSLELFCQANNFTVKTFNQRAQNYEGYETVPDGTDIGYYDRGHLIEESELSRRLAYSEMSVQIDYMEKRSLAERASIALSLAWRSFARGVGGIVSALLSIGLFLLALYAEFSVIYKLHRRTVYKHKCKRPEYYEPKEIVVKKEE